MSDRRTDLILFILPLILVAAFFSGACRSEKNATPQNLIVVNAPASGRVSRIFVAEGTDIAEKAGLIEIAAAQVGTPPAGDQQDGSAAGENIQSDIKAAEDRLFRASVELQRIEPLVAAGGAPQPHLDAARAEYQQAQERVDQLRRRSMQAPLRNSRMPVNNVPARTNPPKVTIVAAPSAGNVRVISVRVGQSVKAGEPVATILTSR